MSNEAVSLSRRGRAPALLALGGGTRILGRLLESVSVTVHSDHIALSPTGVLRLLRMGAPQTWMLPFDRIEGMAVLDDGGLAIDMGESGTGRRVHTLDGEAAGVLSALARVSQGRSGEHLVLLAAVQTIPNGGTLSGVVVLGPGGIELLQPDGTVQLQATMAQVHAITAEDETHLRIRGDFAGELTIDTDIDSAARLARIAASLDKFERASSYPTTPTFRSGRNRRAFFRVQSAEAILAFARPVDNPDGWEECELVDFSAGGFRVRVQGSVKSGELWAFEMPLDFEIPRLFAEVVYLREHARAAGGATVGFRLVQASPHQVSRLQREVFRHDRMHRNRFERIDVANAPGSEGPTEEIVAVAST